MALITGVVLPLIETWRRWGTMLWPPENWPAWIDDYLAAALLLTGWWAGRNHAAESRPYLMAAWGYTLGIAYMSFFAQLRGGAVTDPSGFAIPAVLAFKGFGVLLALMCLGLTWRSGTVTSDKGRYHT